MREIDSICLLGFGEVGQAIAVDLGKLTGVRLTAYDILFEDAGSVPSQGINRLPAVTKCTSAIEAVKNCDLIISAVTAAEALNAARSVTGGLSVETYFLDLNSVSPNTTLELAEIIINNGARFVEAAVMSPIEPKRLASPILLGGQNARHFLGVASKLGFDDTKVFSETLGSASATKMCRSVIIKGLEALLGESLVAARHYGVEQDVVESLHNLLQDDNWHTKAQYMISRSIEHGKRRAEEMREVATALSDAGVEPLMSTACVSRQEWASKFKFALNYDTLPEMLDSIGSNQDKTERRHTAQ